MIEVFPTDHFEKRIKKLQKKYRNTKKDVEPLLDELSKGSIIGDKIGGLDFLPHNESIYKLRIPNTSAKRGKRGGFRLIYYYLTSDKEIYLLDIYSKSEKDDIEDEEIKRLVKEIFNF